MESAEKNEGGEDEGEKRDSDEQEDGNRGTRMEMEEGKKAGKRR